MLPPLCKKSVRRALLVLALFSATGLRIHSQQQDNGYIVIGDVAAQEQNGGIEVRLTTTAGLPSPRVERLTDPNRLVFTFPGAVPKSGYSRTIINKGVLSSVRMSLFRADGQGRPETRVVLDLTQRVAYRTSSSGGIFTISIGDAVSPPIKPPVVANPPAPVQASAPPPVTAPGNTLNDISIAQADGKTMVTLKFNQGENPRTMYLEDPRRFVLDFPGVGFGADWMKPPTLRVNSPAVSAVRSSLFREQPPVVRVVFDQAAGSQAPKIDVQGSTVTVEFSDHVRAMRTAPQVRSNAHAASRQIVRAAVREPVNPVPDVHNMAEAIPTPPPVPESASIRPQPARGIVAVPPVVVYQGGLLSVEAENAVLIDVLYAIGEKTGAAVEMPMADRMMDKVALKIGPRKPREVISTLLEGSAFNYFIIEDAQGKLQKVMLTPKEQQ